METSFSEAPVVGAAPRPLVGYPTIKESWGFLGWYLLSSVVAGVPIFLVGEQLAGLSRPVTLLLMVVASNCAVLWLMKHRQAVRWSGINLHGRVPGWLIIALPVLVLSADMVLSVVELLHLPKIPSGNTYRQLMKQPVVGFLTICVAAPILEELLLRGMLLQGLLRNFPTRPWVAIGQSALIFGVMHLNPPQSLATFLLGLLMGWLYYRTRSLWLCMGVHFLNNLFAFYGLLHQRVDAAEHMVQSFGSPWIYTGVVVLSAGVLAALLGRVQQTTTVTDSNPVQRPGYLLRLRQEAQ